MRTILHIVTRAEDTLSRDIIERQREFSDVQIDVVELTGSTPDYDALVQKIFAADSIEVF
ncbi:MAG TPA: hypothetical protein VGF13_03000 [Verrucomicrobiae bacterium]|jgi:hypothetical protein